MEINLNDLSSIQKYLNELIKNLQTSKRLDEDDLINLLTIIYNEYISDDKNILIKSLIITLLNNYIEILNKKKQEDSYYHIYNINYLPIKKGQDYLENTFESLMTQRVLNITRDL